MFNLSNLFKLLHVVRLSLACAAFSYMALLPDFKIFECSLAFELKCLADVRDVHIT